MLPHLTISIPLQNDFHVSTALNLPLKSSKRSITPVFTQIKPVLDTFFDHDAIENLSSRIEATTVKP
jgi:hypothetical protein